MFGESRPVSWSKPELVYGVGALVGYVGHEGEAVRRVGLDAVSAGGGIDPLHGRVLDSSVGADPVYGYARAPVVRGQEEPAPPARCHVAGVGPQRRLAYCRDGPRLLDGVARDHVVAASPHVEEPPSGMPRQRGRTARHVEASQGFEPPAGVVHRKKRDPVLVGQSYVDKAHLSFLHEHDAPRTYHHPPE